MLGRIRAAFSHRHANGNGAGSVTPTLPALPESVDMVLQGVEAALNGKLLRVVTVPGQTYARVTFYDDTYPGANNARFILSGWYEAATGQ